MALIEVTYCLSSEGQKRAIHAGVDAHRKQIILLDDPDLALLDEVVIGTDGSMSLDLRHRGVWWKSMTNWTFQSGCPSKPTIVMGRVSDHWEADDLVEDIHGVVALLNLIREEKALIEKGLPEEQAQADAVWEAECQKAKEGAEQRKLQSLESNVAYLDRQSKKLQEVVEICAAFLPKMDGASTALFLGTVPPGKKNLVYHYLGVEVVGEEDEDDSEDDEGEPR